MSQPQLRWDALTIGHLSRNKYWGEREDRPQRPALCTSTLVRCPGGPTIVVDPGQEPEQLVLTLRNRTGLMPEDVDFVLLTHFHADHRVGVDAFPQARWVMAESEVEALRRSVPADDPAQRVLAEVEPADEVLGKGATLFPTPGHTPGHHSLLLETEEATVVIAGDAVMTRDFFTARDFYFNTQDPGQAVETIEHIARIADVIVPGHDQSFLARGFPPRKA